MSKVSSTTNTEANTATVTSNVVSNLPNIIKDEESIYVGKFSAEQERAIMEMVHQSLGGSPSNAVSPSNVVKME